MKRRQIKKTKVLRYAGVLAQKFPGSSAREGVTGYRYEKKNEDTFRVPWCRKTMPERPLLNSINRLSDLFTMMLQCIPHCLPFPCIPFPFTFPAFLFPSFSLLFSCILFPFLFPEFPLTSLSLGIPFARRKGA